DGDRRQLLELPDDLYRAAAQRRLADRQRRFRDVRKPADLDHAVRLRVGLLGADDLLHVLEVLEYVVDFRQYRRLVVTQRIRQPAQVLGDPPAGRVLGQIRTDRGAVVVEQVAD